MEIMQELFNFFGIQMLSQSSTFVELVEYIINLFFAVFIVVSFMRMFASVTTFNDIR